MSIRPSRGFTLIEMLTALFILALLAVAGYRGLTSVSEAREAASQETRKWQQVMVFFSHVEQDVAQALPRPVRGPDGNILPEWLGLSGTPAGPDEAQLTFTRGGAPDGGEAQMIPQRIGYRLDGDRIMLLRWAALDQPMEPVVHRHPLLSGVREFRVRHLAPGGGWLEAWPPPGQHGGLPAALEVTVTLTSGETLVRDFALQ